MFDDSRSSLAARLLCFPVAALLGLTCLESTAQAQASRSWSGNFVTDPGFEEDFINNNAEAHVISFKCDWFYNQQDLVPDFWNLKGAWSWNDKAPHSGRKSLKLEANAAASQDYHGAVFQSGGSAWSGAPTTPIALTRS